MQITLTLDNLPEGTTEDRSGKVTVVARTGQWPGGTLKTRRKGVKKLKGLNSDGSPQTAQVTALILNGVLVGEQWDVRSVHLDDRGREQVSTDVQFYNAAKQFRGNETVEDALSSMLREGDLAAALKRR